MTPCFLSHRAVSPRIGRRFAALWLGLGATLIFSPPAPAAPAAPARDAGADRRPSGLWDRALYPAAGRYRDLLSAAQRHLSARPPSAAHHRRARALIRAATRLSPRRPQAWHLLGKLHATRGRWAKAADAFAKARTLGPHYRPRNLTYAFAMAALRAGRYTAAARAFLSLRRARDTSRVTAILLTNAAEAYSAAGHLRRAVRLYRQAISEDLRYPAPRWGLAVAQHRAGKPRLAVRLATAALQVDPQAQALLGPQALFVPPAARHYHLALLYEARREPARARRSFEEYLEARPRTPYQPQVREALARLSQATAKRPRPAPRRPTRRRPRSRP
jgi:tetratricopeptide (TPR) repeat protein